jgi:hypothetical protein
MVVIEWLFTGCCRTRRLDWDPMNYDLVIGTTMTIMIRDFSS